jgi:hypothetical protein
VLAIDPLVRGRSASATAHDSAYSGAREGRLVFGHARTTGQEESCHGERYIFFTPHLGLLENRESKFAST